MTAMQGTEHVAPNMVCFPLGFIILGLMFGLEAQSRARARSCQLWSRQWRNRHLIPLCYNLMVGCAHELLLGLIGE